MNCHWSVINCNGYNLIGHLLYIQYAYTADMKCRQDNLFWCIYLFIHSLFTYYPRFCHIGYDLPQAVICLSVDVTAHQMAYRLGRIRMKSTLISYQMSSKVRNVTQMGNSLGDITKSCLHDKERSYKTRIHDGRLGWAHRCPYDECRCKIQTAISR